MSIKVVIADDHPLIRSGVRLVVERTDGEMEVIGEAVNGLEVLKLAEKYRGMVYLLDVVMPELNGLETARRLLLKEPTAKIIMLSQYGTRNYVQKAFDNGARGYLLKDNASENVLEAIRAVCAGEYYLCPAIAKHFVKTFLGEQVKGQSAPEMIDLSDREREVLQLIGEGFASKEIAAKLDIASNTVHAHRSNVMEKLGVHKQSELIRYALREGIAKL